jgi:hypothetical protein
VEDNIAPAARCVDVTVELDADGQGTLAVDEVDAGSTDACGIVSRVLSRTAFDCGDVGLNPVTLTLTDSNGNVNTCGAVVDVQDNLPPVMVCQAVTVQLDQYGHGSIGLDDVDGGSWDNCQIASRELSASEFGCGEVGGNEVTLTIRDIHGNVASCTVVVTVEDNVPPVALCRDRVIQLDADGRAAIVPADIDAGSDDACGIAAREVSRGEFGCADVGENAVTLTVTDANANTDACTATVTVEDNVAPVLSCGAEMVEIETADDDDDDGYHVETYMEITHSASDACGLPVYEAVIDIGCRRIAVADGQLLDLRCVEADDDDDDGPCVVDETRRDGVLGIVATEALFTVTVSDPSGNTEVCEVDLCTVLPPPTLP